MNAKELGDMPAFPLPVIKDDKGHPMVHAHPYNQGMTVRQVASFHVLQGLLSALTPSGHPWFPGGHKVIVGQAIKYTDALLAILARDTE